MLFIETIYKNIGGELYALPKTVYFNHKLKFVYNIFSQLKKKIVNFFKKIFKVRNVNINKVYITIKNLKKYKLCINYIKVTLLIIRRFKISIIKRL